MVDGRSESQAIKDGGSCALTNEMEHQNHREWSFRKGKTRMFLANMFCRAVKDFIVTMDPLDT
jgi:hypothetical protein